MNKRIRSMIDTLFADMKMTAENLALRDELMANALARYEDVLSQGKTEEDAFASVAASLENVSDLLSELNSAPSGSAESEPDEQSVNDKVPPIESDEAAQDAPQLDLGDTLNKAFTTLGIWGQSLMPQAKKFARQMDDATGGMFSDIGRAVNKGMLDVQKAANEVLDRLEQEKAAEFAADSNTEKTPDDLREEAKDLRAQAGIKRAVGSEAEAQALEDQADLLAAQADALAQAIAIEEAAKTTQSDAFYGADGELDEEAFARSVEDMSREAEEILSEHTAASQSNELRFPAVGLHQIDAKLDADDITLVPSDSDEVIVRWATRNAEGEPEVSFDHHTLSIRRKNPDVFKTFFSVFSKNGGAITLLIPRGYAADYTLRTTSGNVHLCGLDADNIEVSTTSGNVRIEPDLSVRANELSAESISGCVTISARAQEIEAKSVSGNVFLSCDAVSVTGEVVSGKLHIEGACDALDVNAVSGSAELLCTTAPTREINADTISGSVVLHLPASIRGFSVAFESMGGSLINEFGADHFGTCALPIHLNTISGNMRIKRL